MLAAEVIRTAGSTPHVPMCCPASRARPEWSPPAAEALHAASPCRLPCSAHTGPVHACLPARARRQEPRRHRRGPPRVPAGATRCGMAWLAARDTHAAAGRAGSRSDPPRLHALLVTGVRESTMHLLLSCL
jgi:hypothetical protein